MTPVLSKILATILLPPSINIILIIFAVILYYMQNKLAAYSIGFVAVFTLYLSSIPYTAEKLAHFIEPSHSLNLMQENLEKHGAIVLLGCSRYSNPLEYADDSVSPCSLSRMLYLTEILNRIDLPILISGGSVFNEKISEAEIISNALSEKFGIKPDWLETKSQNTIENALFSYEILNSMNINTIILVTHAMHMKRAEEIFTKTGFSVTAAPTYFIQSKPAHSMLLRVLPSSEALHQTSSLLREMIGLIWFRLSFTD